MIVAACADQHRLSGQMRLDDLFPNQPHIWPDGIKMDKAGEMYIGREIAFEVLCRHGVLAEIVESGKDMRQVRRTCVW